MFKVDNKNTRVTSMFTVNYNNTRMMSTTYFTRFSTVSIVDLKDIVRTISMFQ